MNKHAQTMPLAILSFLAVIIVGFTLIQFLLPEISDFRVNIGCADADTLSDGGMVLCLISDGIIPYVIISVLALAIGLITARMKL